MIRQRLFFSIAAIAAASALAAMLACLAAASVNQSYYKLHPFIGDTSSFFHTQFALYFEVLGKSKIKTIWNLFVANPKNPLAYLHFIFLPRPWLLSMNSHLVFTGAAFAAFSALFGWAVYQRTGSILYAVIAPFIIFCMEGLFDPIYQLPSKLADPPAVFVFGCAVMCLVNSRQGRSVAWLVAFGAFAALTLLSRFTAAVYLFFSCAPVLAAYLLRLGKDPQYGWRHVWRAIAVMAVPIIVLAGYHFVAHVGDVISFYGTFWGVSGEYQGFAASLDLTLLKYVVNFLGGAGVGIPVLFSGMFFAMFWRHRADSRDVFTTVWLAAAVPIWVVVIFRVVDDSPQLAYGLAGYLLLAVAPFSIAPLPEEERRRLNAFAAVAACALVPITAYALLARPNIVYVRKVNPEEIQLLQANRKMVQFATMRHSEVDRPLVIDANFDYHWRHLQPTALYDPGRLLLAGRQFEIREEQWRFAYGNKNPEELGRYLASEYNAKVDLLYLIADPRAKSSAVLMKDDFTADVAERLATWLATAPGWKKVGTVTEYPHGPVDVWVNGNRR